MDIATGFKKVRQVVASLSLVTMIATLLIAPLAKAATYSDVPADAWFATYVDQLSTAGVLDTTQTKFRPGDKANRAEAAKLLVTAAGLTLETPASPSFKDVAPGAWYYQYVETAAAHGIVGGYKDGAGNLTGKFGPNDVVTREQFAKMAVMAFDLANVSSPTPTFPDVKADRWSYDYVETLYNWSVVDGYNDGTFGPEKTINRAEIGKMVVGGMNPVVRPGPVEPPVGTGNLNVSLGMDNPAGTTIPSNATSVNVLSFNMMAASDAVTVNSITIHKGGVSALPSGFQGYLYKGNDRLTGGKSVNSTTNEMVFSNLNMAIAKGETVSLMLKADMGDITATGDVRFEVTAIDSNSQSVSGLPVTGEKFDLSTTDVGTITIYKNGTIANPKVGEDGVTIAKFKITADTEGAMLQQLGLYLSGTISTSDVENLKLWVTGEPDALATVGAVNSKDVATFVLAKPYVIEKGGTKSFSVTADLNTGRNADVLKAYIDETTDVVAIGDKYGFGMKVDIATTGTYDGTTCTSSAGNCTYSTLEGGDITISSSGPTASDIAVNAKDVSLLNFNITSVSAVTFKNFDVGLIASVEAATAGGLIKDSDDSANFTDIKIINTKTGKTLMGPVDSTSFVTADGGATVIGDATDAAQAFYLFTDEFTMAAGESLDLALTADVANNSSLNNETVIASLQLGSTYPEIRDVNNKVLTNTTSLVPSSDITGKTMTGKSSGLTLSLAATPVSDTFVKGNKNVKFTGLSFACGTGSDCKVTDITLQGYIDDNGNASAFSATGTGADHTTLLNSYVGSVALKDNADGVIAASKSVQSDGTVVYSNLNWNIKAGETQTAYVVGDLSSNSFANSDAENIAFGIAAITDVTAEDKDGNSISSITGTPNTSETTYVTTSAGGSLTVAVDPATPKENIVVAAAVDQMVAKYKFTSTDEAFVVKKLAINNRQSAVTAASKLGDYDNNVVAVKLSYTNSLGVAETKTGTLTNGTAQFAGLDMMIPAEGDAVLTVSANLNTIAAGAAAGEFVDLNLGFDSFEAVAQGSGETYKGGKLDADVAAGSDLDFGTITFTNPAGLVLDGAVVTSTTLDSSFTFAVDEGDDTAPLRFLPVGTMLCFDASVTEAGADVTATAGLCDTSTDNLAIITSRTAGVTEDTYTANLVNDPDLAMATNRAIYYALPGTGYLTGSNQMHVYETKPTITVDASSPSGSRSTSASDTAFMFDVAASAQEKVQVRTAKELTTCALGRDVGNDGDDTIDAVNATSIDGSGCKVTKSTATNDDTISFDAGAVSTINQYARASFWIRSDVAPNFVDIQYGTDAAVGGGLDTMGTIDNVATLAYTDCTLNGATVTTTTLAASTWYYCDVAVPAATTTEQYWHFGTHDVTTLANTKFLFIDRLILYNDKIELDMTGDDIDTQTNGAHGLVAYLKDGGDTVATGYVAKNSVASTEGGAAKLTFFPIDGTDSAIEVSKGTSKTFTVQLNTATLLAEDAGLDDPLTFSMDLGTSSGGTVTAGDFWWNDTNFSSSTAGAAPGTSYALTTPGIIKWIGQVSNTTLSGNTVKY